MIEKVIRELALAETALRLVMNKSQDSDALFLVAEQLSHSQNDLRNLIGRNVASGPGKVSGQGAVIRRV
jgi:hypothetical protein